MVVREGALLVIGILAGLTVLGWGVSKVTKKDDHPVEELAEEIIENQLEDLLNLPDDTFDIDLTPSSEEVVA